MITLGTVFASRYGIIKKINSGGMADIYKAKDLKLGRLVAIKVLKEKWTQDAELVRHFEIEGRAAACLDNANVVSIYDVGCVDGTYFIVMELIDGITLKDYIERKGVLTPRETMAIAAQVAVGLRAAHAHHIIHSDVKPQNIMLTRDGKVKISDFGIARTYFDENRPLPKSALGSVYYMSPEQAKGKAFDERSDLYSLGITMYEMITGRVPFDKDTAELVTLAHMNERMVPPSQYNPECPKSLEQIIFHCTQKLGAKRYMNCTEFLQDLKIAVSNPDFDFEKESKKNALKKNTRVFSPEETANVRRQDRGETESEGENGAEEMNDHEYGDEESELRDRIHEGNTEEMKARKRVQKKFDRFIFGASVVLGVAILGMIIYLIVSMSGCSQGTIREESTDDMVTLDTISEEDYNPNTDARIPNLIGKDVKEAIDLLTEAELVYKISTTVIYSDQYEMGKICKQSYPKDTIVRKGSTITIVISAGTDKFTIKDSYVGGSLQDFKSDFAKFSDIIQVEYERVESNTVPANTIISLNPSSGVLKPGDKIKVRYSAGPAYVTVPNLIGSDESSAKAALLNAGLNVGEVYDDYSDTVEKGKVSVQQYAAGARVKNGTRVSFGISIGPKVTVLPDVVGQKEEDAVKQLEDAGFKVKVEYEENPDKSDGIVLAMSPDASKNATIGETITLTVCKNAGEVGNYTLENYVGSGIDEIRKKLETKGIVVIEASVPTTDENQNNIIKSQDKPAGTKCKVGDTLALEVYHLQKESVVPDFTQMTVEEARKVAQSMGIGLVVNPSAITTNDPSKDGKIADQSEMAGTPVTPNMSVNVSYYKYAAEPSSAGN